MGITAKHIIGGMCSAGVKLIGVLGEEMRTITGTRAKIRGKMKARISRCRLPWEALFSSRVRREGGGRAAEVVVRSTRGAMVGNKAAEAVRKRLISGGGEFVGKV